MNTTVNSTQPSVVYLRYNDHAGKVCVELAECDRIVLAADEAARACGVYEERKRFQAQFEELMTRLCRWTQDHALEIESAYVTVRDGGLLFLVVRRDTEYDREFEDALTELDSETACNEEFDLIRLSVLALPQCPPDAMQSFLSDDVVTLGFQVNGE